MNLVELPKVSQTRPQSAVSEPTRLSVPFDPMSRAVDKPLAHPRPSNASRPGASRSKSISKTRRPSLANIAATFASAIVRPTPPLYE